MMNTASTNTDSALAKFNLGFELDKTWVQAKRDIQARVEK